MICHINKVFTGADWARWWWPLFSLDFFIQLTLWWQTTEMKEGTLILQLKDHDWDQLLRTDLQCLIQSTKLWRGVGALDLNSNNNYNHRIGSAAVSRPQAQAQAQDQVLALTWTWTWSPGTRHLTVLVLELSSKNVFAIKTWSHVQSWHSIQSAILFPSLRFFLKYKGEERKQPWSVMWLLHLKPFLYHWHFHICVRKNKNRTMSLSSPINKSDQ